MQLVIRKYRPSDKDTVRTLFSSGIREHIGPSFSHAMTSPLHLFITLVLCAAGYILSSLFGAVVLLGGWVGLVYYCCHKAFSDYVQMKLQTDMQDIHGHYLSGPDDCFWVAEAEVNGKSQIVATVAVVGKQNGKERRGELFRLVTTPSCRRMGLGIRMTQTVIDFCKERGFSELALETTSSQTAAVALYKNLGFRTELIKTYPPAWVFILARVSVIRMKICL